MTTAPNPNTMTTPDSALHNAFKETMAGVATPVSIVTTMAFHQPCGTTVSAFTSLSLNPPMVLVSLDRGSDTLAAIRRSGRFGLNILGAHHAHTALAFANKGGLDWPHRTGHHLQSHVTANDPYALQ
jgi:flavin reductase (DIM6/NTAB) family NADH-FMN oxidoreductase RutF